MSHISPHEGSVPCQRCGQRKATVTTVIVASGGEVGPTTKLCDTCDTVVYPAAAARRRRARAEFRRRALARPLDFQAVRARVRELESRANSKYLAALAEQLAERVAVNGQKLPEDVRAFVERYRGRCD